MKSFRLWIYRLLTAALPESRGFAFKRMLLRWAGAKVGENVRIYSSVQILGNGALVIGNDVHIGPQVFVSLAAPAVVRIGDCVDIGPRVTLVTGSHEIDPVGSHVAGKGTAADITIADGCWLGAVSTVLPGVAIPEKTLVAAGSVVTASVAESCCLLAGVPARVKKSLKVPR